MTKSRLIFVNEKPFRIWADASLFKSQQFLGRFDASFHFQVAKLLEPELAENEAVVSLAIRAQQGMAAEAFFAMLFAVLQAPDTPEAWVLLYRPGDLAEMVKKVDEGNEFPVRFELASFDWAGIASALIPANDPALVNGEQVLRKFHTFWEQLASDFSSKFASNEFNSIKHGFRAAAGAPYLKLGETEVPTADHGASFPTLARNKSEVLMGVASRNWSVSALLAQMEIIAASMKNLISLLKLTHGLAEQLELEIPDDDVFEKAYPSGRDAGWSMGLATNWPEDFSVSKLDPEEYRERYEELGKFRLRTRL